MGQSVKEVSLEAQGPGQLAGLRILVVKFGMSARLGLVKGKPIMSQNTWLIVLVQLLRPNPGRSLGCPSGLRWDAGF